MTEPAEQGKPQGDAPTTVEAQALVPQVMPLVSASGMTIITDAKPSRWERHQTKSAQVLGIPVQRITSPSLFGGVDINKPDSKLLLRTYVHTAQHLRAHYPDNWFVVSRAGLANEWYNLPRDERWITYFNRNMTLLPVSRDKDGELECKNLRETIQKHFDGKVFIKSTTKDSLSARAYSSVKEAVEHINYLLAFGCHRVPSALLISDYMAIDECQSGYKRKEWRCFMVNGKAATISLFTDRKTRKDYSSIADFAERFAQAYSNDLPTAYCLDVARTDRGMVVVELNDIDASGIFADHDMTLFFNEIINTLEVST